ncbi:MAG: mannose-6-phosphate isomerase, class I [Ferruginibacter sp.]|nr:mannose-6-phosphate isomerase, class I [Chitinophagaceae bacterium]
MAGIYRLQGTVKHYDWGGFSFIPSLLQTQNNENRPFAEYWMGIHPLGHALVDTGNNQLKALKEITGDLPYLFKVLDVKDMLSIQVHPSKATAEKEFAIENAAGIPLDSPQRNYKDDNHKPELIVALSEFWLLHGFKPPEEMVYTLLNVVELRELLPVFNESGYGGLYKKVMEMPQEEVNRILKPLIDNITIVYKDNEPDKNDEDFWALRAAQTFSRGDAIDRGIFSVYLFNLIRLKKGEGIFQPAGMPHAYLEGQNVEIMANSDNVLRGGLTTKHIDVTELLKNIQCEPVIPAIIQAEEISKYEKLYKTPAPDPVAIGFQLSVFELRKDEINSFTTAGTEILLLTDGFAELSSGETNLELRPGSPSAVILPGNTVTIRARGNATVFRASVPVPAGNK